MKSYVRQFVKRTLKEANDRRIESRDAILWSYGSDSSCMVKIQGSNELVVAHYPRNLLNKPKWLRIGNAVRVIHRGGVHGYIEVVGPGRSVPTASIGNSLPVEGITGDGIIWGMVVTETTPPSEGVMISNGAFRINEEVYYYFGELAGYIYMTDPATITMGVTPYADMGESSFVIDEEGSEAPPAGYFRYDFIVIGVDSITHYIVGVATTGEPGEPEIPDDHILVARILRVGGDIAITQDRIYKPWEPPAPTNAIATYPTDVYWSTQQFSISVTVVDQYGRAISSSYSGDGWQADLEMIWGTGEIYSSDSGWQEEEVAGTIFGGSGISFSYRRVTSIAEKSPMFFINIYATKHLVVPIVDVILYDINGLPIGY